MEMTKTESEDPRILNEDSQMLCLAKPAGMHVFGEMGSLSAWLLERKPDLSGVGPSDQPAIAHRLDLQTSGVMLVGKTVESYMRLRQSFSTGEMRKDYLALVCGHLDKSTEVKAALGGRYRRSQRVWVDDGSKKLRGLQAAHTHVEPLIKGSLAGQPVSLLRTRMNSGARHQIRAHLAHLGFPIVGDMRYGAKQGLGDTQDRFFLHAWIVVGPHPAEAGEERSWICPLPEALRLVLLRAEINECDLPQICRPEGLDERPSPR